MSFLRRHLGLADEDRAKMLATLGYESLDSLTSAAIPHAVFLTPSTSLPEPATERQVTEELAAIAAANTPRRSMIGLGYHSTITPAVIRRNVLENPAWYTSYTPYQAEISQGRLEAMLVFQTLVADLTSLPTANASLLDEPTAAAEAMALARRASKAASNRFVVDADTHPQTLAVLRTRAEPAGIDVVAADGQTGVAAEIGEGGFGALVSYPSSLGYLRVPNDVVESAHARGALVVACADLLALTLLAPPGEWGADIAVGSAQRLGVPMGAGGPHAGFMAVRAGLERAMPGRLVGVSVDDTGRPALRLALQTREQHIRRERATSNICTAQVLLASVAAFYAAYHGPDGLLAIALRIRERAVSLARSLGEIGVDVSGQPFFDTVVANLPGKAGAVVSDLASIGIDIRQVDADRVSVSVDETTSADDLVSLVASVAKTLGAVGAAPWPGAAPALADQFDLPVDLVRRSAFMTHDVFHRHTSETEMMRWLRRLADEDIALDRGMIPLGSCTMKLNPAAAMEPITWPGFAQVHPFAPPEHVRGYRQIVESLQRWLAELTGYDAMSIQPNAGSQGEFAGLLAIRAFHRDRGEPQRTVCLIPTSAHGTNAASAAMAGMQVVTIACDDSGGVDLDDLAAKLAEHGDRLAAAMITYPSTYGVYDTAVTSVCELVHQAGGQVYVDGANLNALVGLCAPGAFGADVSHLNLHKTFAVPHGGGGPGVGPVGVRQHLARFLPQHPLSAGSRTHPLRDGVGPVSGAPWGNAGVLPIAYAYLRLMGFEGLKAATQNAVLAANYVAARLHPSFPVLFRGNAGLVAHECIVDLRDLTKASGVTAEDVAKRLIDYGFHAPTLSFPVAGTLMIEPTESESLGELDRFCDAMIQIRAEIESVIVGEYPVAESPLRRAPHTARCLVEEWDRPYSRWVAVYPMRGMTRGKYWPPVGRVDSTAGDRNLVATCPPSNG